jgi:hypothetical protein
MGSTSGEHVPPVVIVMLLLWAWVGLPSSSLQAFEVFLGGLSHPEPVSSSVISTIGGGLAQAAEPPIAQWCAFSQSSSVRLPSMS